MNLAKRLNRRYIDFLLPISWKFPFIRALASSNPLIIIYHGTPQKSLDGGVDIDIFEKQIIFLKANFDIVSIQQLHAKRNRLDKIKVIITFDDGLKNNAEIAAPILKRHNIPAVFFASSRHSKPNGFLWSEYLSMLQHHYREKGFYFQNTFWDMSSDNRDSTLQTLNAALKSLRPHPQAIYAAIDNELPQKEAFVSEGDFDHYYAGMTEDQIRDLALDPLFTFGVHTVDHPFLTLCDQSEASRQIIENKHWLENIAGSAIHTIAYPYGDYDRNVLSCCKQAGFNAGFAVQPKINAFGYLEYPRVGIYSPSLEILGFKIQWGHLIRKLNIPVG
jgi:peptidoglycan/xylan/chitin deacetylase (PgdA/CDA1 family)